MNIIERISVVFVLSIIATLPARSQIVVPYCVGDVWGFSDTSANIVIDPDYTKVEFFGQKYKVYRNDLSGFISYEGKVLVPAEFNYCRQINRASFLVKKDSMFGIVDTANNYLADLIYDTIYQFENQLYAVSKDNLYGVFSLNEKEFKQVIKCRFQYIEYDRISNIVEGEKNAIIFTYNSHGKLIDKSPKGRKKVKAEMEEEVIESIREYSTEDNYPVFIPIEENNKKGLIIKNKSRNIYDYGVIKSDTIFPFYDSINPKHWFSNCLVVETNGKWGAINLEGDAVIEPKYSSIDINSMTFQCFWAKPYKQNFIVKKNNKWGVIGNTNKFKAIGNNNQVLIPFEYDSIYRNVNHSFFIVEAENKYGIVMSKKFKKATAIKYHQILSGYNEIKGFKLFHILDEDGKLKYVGENGIEFFDE